jgi:hypothetical protein
MACGQTQSALPQKQKRPQRAAGIMLESTPVRYQAARTDVRNLPTSLLRRSLSLASDCAAVRTSVEAAPVSVAPRCTSVMLAETCWVPWDACWTLREISCVAAPCSSTAAAIADEISDSRSIVPEISLMALTDSSVAPWMPETC